VLKDEPQLEFSMLVTMDGNESLKRVARAWREKDPNGHVLSSESIERDDSRSIVSGMYLSEAAVNQFQHEIKQKKTCRA
jgi:Kyakuja-Dileera-Zisupton transposase